jgi:predicted AAA+ superfamily ATPase
MTCDNPDTEKLPAAVDAHLRETNPWWQGKPGPEHPRFRRWAFGTLLKKMDAGIAPAVVLRGPRQVGKTTLQFQMIDFLMKERNVAPRRIMRVQFDELPPLGGVQLPILAAARWFAQNILGKTLNEAARDKEAAYLFFDELQVLPAWAPQLKALVDHHTVKVFATGSSALRIEAGRDSLAGRLATVDIGTLLLREISGLGGGPEIAPHLPHNGLEPLLHFEFWRDLQSHGERQRDARDRAFKAFSGRGGYPAAHLQAAMPWAELADQLNETVIRRVIRHDLPGGGRSARRDQALLEEAFRLACRYAGQAPGKALFIREVKNALGEAVAWRRISRALNMLDGSLLLRLVRPAELRLKRTGGYGDKLCICDHALRASWLQEVVPLDSEGLERAPHLADLAGRLAESAVGYYLAGLPHLDLAHFPARSAKPEVDFILSVGDRRIPLEVKYRRRLDELEDTQGLRAFLEKRANNAPFGILVGMTDDARVRDPRIITVSLPSLLLLR